MSDVFSGIILGLAIAQVFILRLLYPFQSGSKEKLVTFEVALRDGGKVQVRALEGYQITRAGALCLTNISGNLTISQCFAPGEWVKVEVLNL